MKKAETQAQQRKIRAAAQELVRYYFYPGNDSDGLDWETLDILALDLKQALRRKPRPKRKGR